MARAIIDQLPNESIIYVGDTANSPYGPKSIQEVRELALGVMDRLVDEGVKLLVIACNSASAAVLRDARERYTEGRGIPVVEVIQPAVRRAVASTRNRKIGVIGTNATIASGAYDDAFAAAVDLQISSEACPRFVEFVERGRTSGPEVTLLAQRMLAPIIDAKVDALLLGCTHYPYLARVISDVVGLDVTLVSSADETAFALRDQLDHQHMLRKEAGYLGRHTFMSSGDVSWFKALGTRLLGPELSNVDIWNKGN